MSGTKSFRYDAFISYAHEDYQTARWLSQILSNTWVPGKRRRAIFQDRTHLRAGILPEELTEAIKHSRFLIVCCSPDARKSEWVDQEIEAFSASHGLKSILACWVGSATDEPVLPSALQRLVTGSELQLYLPDLRGFSPGSFVTQKRAYRENALALLAALVDLPDKEAVIGRRHRSNLIMMCSCLLVLVSGITVRIWLQSDAYQLHVTSEYASKILPQTDPFDQCSWYFALALQNRSHEAWTLGNSIGKPEDRAYALSCALVGLPSGQDPVPFIRDAVSATRSISVLDDRATALAHIASALAESNRSDQADKIAHEALMATHAIPVSKGYGKNITQMLPLAAIAVAFARAGNVEQAFAVLSEISYSSLSNISAEAFARAGQYEAAMRASHNAHQMEAETFAEVALIFAQLGKAEHAKQAAAEALRNFKVDRTDFTKVARIVEALGRTGSPRVARNLLESATSTLRPAEKNFAVPWLLAILTRAVSDTGDAVETEDLIAEVLPMLEKLDPINKIHVTTILAEDQAAVSNRSRALGLTNYAARSVMEIRSKQEKSKAVEEVALTFAHLRAFSQALAASSDCDPREKLSIYAAILREHAIRNGRVLALWKREPPPPLQFHVDW